MEEGGDEEVNKKYKIKYYKGLGTSTAVESKEYFNDFTNKLVNYVWSLGTNSKLINTKSDLYEHLSGGNGQ